MARLSLARNSPITCLAFHEREYSYRGIIATGSLDGSIVFRTWNADNTPPGEKAKWEWVTTAVLKVRTRNLGEALEDRPGVTALRFIGLVDFCTPCQCQLNDKYRETMIHGDVDGKTYIWTFPG